MPLSTLEFEFYFNLFILETQPLAYKVIMNGEKEKGNGAPWFSGLQLFKSQEVRGWEPEESQTPLKKNWCPL